MKKGLLVLFMASMLVFAENQNVAKKHDKTAKLEKDSYCTVPKSHSDFKKINGKDYRVDVEFEKCWKNWKIPEKIQVYAFEGWKKFSLQCIR